MDVSFDFSALSLTQHQLAMLGVLTAHAGQPLSREYLNSETCQRQGKEAETYDPVTDRSVDVHIGKIRRELKRVSAGVEISTVRFVGYVLREREEGS